MIVAAGAAAWFGVARAEAGLVQLDEAAGVVSCRIGDLRYEYHGASEREALYDVGRDSRCLVNVIAQRTEDAARCRELIEKKLGPGTLESLRDRFARSRARLRALGYL